MLRFRIDEKYGKVHPDATVLLRPKTALKDMVAELDPGRRGKLLHSGDTLPISSTNPDVNFDEILAGLDGDTRAALVALLQGRAQRSVAKADVSSPPRSSASSRSRAIPRRPSGSSPSAASSCVA